MKPSPFSYHEESNRIKVTVTPEFLSEKSNFKDQFFYAYHVTITNNSAKKCQLLRRRWLITDGNGKVEEIFGDGVVGHQPQLQTGESFEYSSFCPLTTATGNMRGSFFFCDEEGGEFEAKIPLFFLRHDLASSSGASEGRVTH